MKRVLILLGFILLCLQNSIAQVQDSTEWGKYRAQIERLFEKATQNSQNECCSDLPDFFYRRYDSLMKEWKMAAIVIQNNSNLSDSAKVAVGFGKYWELFGMCHDTSYPNSAYRKHG